MSNLSYLEDGTPTQREALTALREARVFDILSAFGPVLAGTVPLDVDIEGSDLDVICSAPDLRAFADLIGAAWPETVGRIHVVREVESFVARLSAGRFVVEIFAQATPVEAQYAVLHLRIERRLLSLGGETARRSIRALKRLGMKTEPAFARHFALEGDPYDTLAALAKLSDGDLKRAIKL